MDATVYAEADSEIDVDDESTTTVPQELYEYNSVSGREFPSTYWRTPGYAPYLLPVDEQERNRLNREHIMYSILSNKRLYEAPIEAPTKVLDVGTGTGRWTVEMGAAYPAAAILGIDINPVQCGRVPSNVVHQLDDANRPWTFPRDAFDFIHARGIKEGILSWVAFTQNLTYCLREGGWVEVTEWGPPIAENSTTFDDSHLGRWKQLWCAANEVMGRDVNVGQKLAGLFREAGFEDVQEVRNEIPLGPWPEDDRERELGQMQLENFLDGVEGYTLQLFQEAYDWSLDDVQHYLDDLRHYLRNLQKDISNADLRVSWPV